MIFDYTYFGNFLGLVVFPDWCFAELPKENPGIEEVFLQGTTASQDQSFGGNVDD